MRIPCQLHFNMLVGRFYILNRNHNWTFLLHEFFFFPFFFARIFFLGIFPCMNFFFGFFPIPPITFLMVRPLNREYRYTAKIVIPRFCPIHFTITFAGQTNVDRYTRNIVIPKIVKPGFHCMSYPGYSSIFSSMFRNLLSGTIFDTC